MRSWHMVLKHETTMKIRKFLEFMWKNPAKELEMLEITCCKSIPHVKLLKKFLSNLHLQLPYTLSLEYQVGKVNYKLPILSGLVMHFSVLIKRQRMVSVI
jgi:hypothetical protein